MEELKIRKGQKCNKCKKPIKGEYAYNGKWWCIKCKDKDSDNKIKNYLNEV